MGEPTFTPHEFPRREPNQYTPGTNQYAIYDQTVAAHPVSFPAPANLRAEYPPEDSAKAPGYVVKDSGVREEYDSGMVRDTQEGKARFDLLRPKNVPYDEQFLTRVAAHMTLGAEKYGLRNWETANSQEEVERFENSAERHLHQYLAGETDEDHAAAVVFNLLAAETTRWKMKQNG